MFHSKDLLLRLGFGRGALSPLVGFHFVSLWAGVSPLCVFGFICSERSDFRAAGAVWLLLLLMMMMIMIYTSQNAHK